MGWDKVRTHKSCPKTVNSMVKKPKTPEAVPSSIGSADGRGSVNKIRLSWSGLLRTGLLPPSLDISVLLN